MPCLLRAAAQALLKHDKLVVHHDLFSPVVLHRLEHRRAGLIPDHLHITKLLVILPLEGSPGHDDLSWGLECVRETREEVCANDLRGVVAVVRDDVGRGGGSEGEGRTGGLGVVDGEGCVERDFGLLVELGQVRPLRERVVGPPGAEAAGPGDPAEGVGAAAVRDVVEGTRRRTLCPQLLLESTHFISRRRAKGDLRGLVDRKELVLDNFTIRYAIQNVTLA
mmetsp:Transcript_21992/g.54374  ORF Transcript_21992/g.54374 Transcript_21992/m.54374 type:complete len:222 (+) Transcript_21992:169-834(+)